MMRIANKTKEPYPYLLAMKGLTPTNNRIAVKRIKTTMLRARKAAILRRLAGGGSCFDSATKVPDRFPVLSTHPSTVNGNKSEGA
jgi:hypothetical protein